MLEKLDFVYKTDEPISSTKWQDKRAEGELL